jgi:ATP/maltotriose-dependent transcriptional regulator MalT
VSAIVVGREEELASIEAFLGRIREGPAALVLSGEAGIGKTILWERGVEEAGRRFGRVLRCHGVEAEASLSFAGLSELLGGVLEEAAPCLPPPRRRALEVALLLVEPGEQPPDAHAIGLAVLDVLRLLVERGPLLVALDDAQWLDPASAGVLSIGLRRLTDEPVRLLATLRRGPEGAAPFELDRVFAEELRERVSLGPLSLGAIHSLLRERLGLELTRPELVRVQEATAGNPFFALELGRELVRTNTRPAAGRSLRVPESLHELLGGRLARLPGETLDVLLPVAALARPTIDLVAGLYGSRDRVATALEVAVQEGVVQLDESRLRFSHPLLASLCYEQAPVWKRQAVHRALAAALTDVEERARHLALAAGGPDAATASHLEAAAEQAAARGATASAAELAELAAELTPDDPTLTRKRRLRSAVLHRLSGDVDRAVATLELLLAIVPPGLEKADVLIELAVTQIGGPRANIEQCDQALIEAEGDDSRSATILTLRAGNHLVEGDARAGLDDARAALEKAERVGDPVLLARTIAYLGQAETYHDEITPGLLERAVEIEERLGLELDWNFSPRYVLGRRLMRLGETDRVRVILEQVGTRALERGDEVSRMMALWPLALVEWLAGRWQPALARAAEAFELTEQTRHSHALGWVGRAKALIEADLGLVAEARVSAEDSLAFSEASSNGVGAVAASGVLGRLELALGNLRAAHGYLHELPARLLAGGMHDPSSTVWADAIEMFVARGELDEARSCLDPYEAHAVHLGSAWALCGAARCRGLVAAAEGDLDGAFAALERSLAAAAAFPFERARTLFSLGAVRRQAQQKRAARESLEGALAIFEELGARLWAEKARGELARISGRAPAPEELTGAERRVAELAARGRSNREIAAELFMGVSTVEAHLSRVYRKLGVRRSELATRLGAARDGAAKTVDATAQS